MSKINVEIETMYNIGQTVLFDHSEAIGIIKLIEPLANTMDNMIEINYTIYGFYLEEPNELTEYIVPEKKIDYQIDIKALDKIIRAAEEEKEIEA